MMARHGTTWRGAVAGILVSGLAMLAGCSHAPPAPDPERILTFRSHATVNGARPLYVLVRAVDEGAFMQEDYKAVALKAAPPAKDEKLRGLRFAWPGHDEVVVVQVADDEAFAVYALFTEPGEPWKVLLSPPHTKAYTFLLENGTVTLAPPNRPRRPAESRPQASER